MAVERSYRLFFRLLISVDDVYRKKNYTKPLSNFVGVFFSSYVSFFLVFSSDFDTVAISRTQSGANFVFVDSSDDVDCDDQRWFPIFSLSGGHGSGSGSGHGSGQCSARPQIRSRRHFAGASVTDLPGRTGKNDVGRFVQLQSCLQSGSVRSKRHQWRSSLHGVQRARLQQVFFVPRLAVRCLCIVMEYCKEPTPQKLMTE